MNELLTLVTAQQSTLQSQQADIRQVIKQSQFYHPYYYYHYYRVNIELGDKTTTNLFLDSMRQRNKILMVTMFRQIREEFLGILQIK